MEGKVRIVASVPGSKSGEDAASFGALRLREVVKDIIGKERVGDMEICTASVGAMNEDWM